MRSPILIALLTILFAFLTALLASSTGCGGGGGTPSIGPSVPAPAPGPGPVPMPPPTTGGSLWTTSWSFDVTPSAGCAAPATPVMMDAEIVQFGTNNWAMTLALPAPAVCGAATSTLVGTVTDQVLAMPEQSVTQCGWFSILHVDASVAAILTIVNVTGELSADGQSFTLRGNYRTNLAATPMVLMCSGNFTVIGLRK